MALAGEFEGNLGGCLLWWVRVFVASHVPLFAYARYSVMTQKCLLRKM